jgi:hypothetical protein
MTERARRTSHLRDLEHRYAELDVMTMADIQMIRNMLDPLMFDNITRMDLEKALTLLAETKERQAEMQMLLRKITTLKDELGCR